MAKKGGWSHFRLSIVLLLLFSSSLPALVASNMGRFNGLLLNEAGRPLTNILIALLRKSSEAAIPILARTNKVGQILLSDIEAGSYQILVKSSRYRNSRRPAVEIFPGQTSVLTLVLQRWFDLNPSEDANVGTKSLLRTSVDERLIFRHRSKLEAKDQSFQRPLFERAVFQVYTHGGLGGDYLVFPGDPVGGTTTNFAVMDSLGSQSNYTLAGQLNSGEDSLWRLKNRVHYRLSDAHSLKLFMGYGRLSFEQPSLSLLNNPAGIRADSGYTRATATIKTLSLSFEESWRLGDAVSLVWGLEWDQVRSSNSYSFLSPSAEIAYAPRKSTVFRVLTASKRSNQGNSVTLQDGSMVNLADAVYFARLGEHLSVGTSRYDQASISQEVGDDTVVELAAYRNRLFRGAVPVLAVLQYAPEAEVLRLTDEQVDNRGYRLTVQHRVTQNLKGVFSYVRGSAAGLGLDCFAVVLGEPLLQEMISQRDYHLLSTQVEALISQSQTRLMALVKFVPGGRPITPLDAFSDRYETANEGVNLFIRQLLPLPVGLLNMLGLDFLSLYQVEVLLDVRNLLDHDLGKVRTPMGDVVLVRNPRSVRGGISLKF